MGQTQTGPTIERERRYLVRGFDRDVLARPPRAHDRDALQRVRRLVHASSGRWRVA